MLLPAITFMLCLVAILGLYWGLIVRPEDTKAKAISGRLHRLDSPRSAAIGVASAATRLSEVPALEALLKKHAGFTASIQQLLVEADLTMTVGVFLSLSLVSAGIGWAIGLLGLRLFSVALLLAAIGASVPYLYVRSKRTTRLRVFEEQFPEAIDSSPGRCEPGMRSRPA